jgi:sodium/bile acid cotransporter 7
VAGGPERSSADAGTRSLDGGATGREITRGRSVTGANLTAFGATDSVPGARETMPLTRGTGASVIGGTVGSVALFVTTPLVLGSGAPAGGSIVDRSVVGASLTALRVSSNTPPSLSGLCSVPRLAVMRDRFDYLLAFEVQFKGRPDWFLLGIVAALSLAWFFPEPGAKGGVLEPELTNKLGVALIFYLHGLTLSLAALKRGMLLFRLHLVVQLTTFLVFPLLAVALYHATSGLLPDGFRAGIVYLGALPSTVSSSVALTAAARGNVPAAVFNATLSSLLGVVLTPLWLGLVLGASGRPLPFVSVVLDLCALLLLPLVLGQLSRPWLGDFAGRHKAKIGVADRLTILFLVYTSFCDSVKGRVWSEHGLSLVLVTVLLAALLLGSALSFTTLSSKLLGFSLEDRIAAVFCGSKKTLASGVPMAQLIFGADPALGLILTPILVYHPLQLVVCGVLAGRFAARK